MIWNKSRILQELRRLHRVDHDLSYNGLAKSMQSLVSAAAYHFGSYRGAVEQAGIDYASVIRRPRWTKKEIIRLIRIAKRNREDLHWSAVTKRRDELGKAAFASLQPRLFGKWERALQASGLDAEDISRYRRWDRESIIGELKSRIRQQQPVNSGAIQKSDPGLHAAAVRHFGNYDAALRAAKIDPSQVRRRRVWDKADIIKATKAAGKAGKDMSDSHVRRESPSLYGAAIRVFGSFTAAREAAGVKFARKKRAR